MFIKKYLLPVLLLAVFSVPFSALANFDFNTNCFKAYQAVFELRLGSARQLVATEKRVHPDNAIVPLLENYIDYFYLITADNKLEFDRLKDKYGERLDRIEADKDRNSPYYLYAQAEINLQWALLHGKYGEYFTSAKAVKRANSMLNANVKKFPGFHLNMKGIGLINVFLGNMPDGVLKSALATFGISGNTQKGLAILDKLCENLPKSSYEPFYEEVVFYYAFTLTDIVHSPQAYAKTMKFTQRIADSSLLKSYLQAYVCLKNAHNEEAISILASRPNTEAYADFPYLDYLMGIAKLNKLDLTAGNYFNRFLQGYKGTNYIKSANLHLSWIAILRGDTGSYSVFTSKVKTNGYSFIEKDKQAINDAAAGIPNTDLLKARLLFDGGYLNRALGLFGGKSAADYRGLKDRTEFYYRLGRIYDGLGRDEVALGYYQNAINIGKNTKYYFASNAALQMGKIYSRLNDNEKAKAFYAMAINMKDHEFKNSISNEAKQGLKNLSD
ncbi:MAG: tetratricopeptide repeat protein [Pedobacter sp.]|nr:MAG: tetratricopeptide repeat protein [Pedobacter sp.]